MKPSLKDFVSLYYVLVGIKSAVFLRILFIRLLEFCYMAQSTVVAEEQLIMEIR